MTRYQQWPPWLVASTRSQLDELASVTLAFQGMETAEYLARFLVIRSSGYLEQTVFEVFRSYVEARSGGLVKSFAHSWLEKSRIPSPENLEEMVGRFDSALRDELTSVLGADDERLRRELSFLMDRRNRIAHGLNEGVGSAKAIRLKKVSVEIADWFILRFNPD